MARKKAKSTTSFPQMGTEASRLGRIAQPQRGRSVRKVGEAKRDVIAPTAAVRGNVQERLGFRGAPQTVLYAPNAAEASQTQRNTVLVPSALGNRDFYLRRQYGQGM